METQSTSQTAISTSRIRNRNVNCTEALAVEAAVKAVKAVKAEERGSIELAALEGMSHKFHRA